MNKKHPLHINRSMCKHQNPCKAKIQGNEFDTVPVLQRKPRLVPFPAFPAFPAFFFKVAISKYGSSHPLIRPRFFIQILCNFGAPSLQGSVETTQTNSGPPQTPPTLSL